MGIQAIIPGIRVIQKVKEEVEEALEVADQVDGIKVPDLVEVVEGNLASNKSEPSCNTRSSSNAAMIPS